MPPAPRGAAEHASTAQGGTSTPAARARRCAASLSIHRALASTPQPTQGMPASASSPCTVPSSPFFPCSTGNAASRYRAARALHQQAVDRSVRRQRHRRTFLFFPYALPYGVQRAAVPEPPALPRDTHRHGFKARTLHGVQNGAGRLQRDRMLGGLSPEQHGDFYFFHLDGPFPLFVENRTIVPHVPDGRAGERLSKILRHSEHPLKRGRSQRHLFYNKFLKSH